MRDRRSPGRLTLATLYANRTPALGLRRWFRPRRAAVVRLLDSDRERRNRHPGRGVRPERPVRIRFTLAITTPELPLISEGKAVDVAAFEN